MVRVLHAMGGNYQDAAARVLTSLLDREPGHPGALAAYAMMAAERGMPSDAVRVLLSLLVQRPEDTAIRCSPGLLLTASFFFSLETHHPLCALAADAMLAAVHSIAWNPVGAARLCRAQRAPQSCAALPSVTHHHLMLTEATALNSKNPSLRGFAAQSPARKKLATCLRGCPLMLASDIIRPPLLSLSRHCREPLMM